MRMILILIVCVGVLVAIVAGLLAIGTPGEARLKKLDERRVSDLEAISFAVNGYWSRHDSLPQTLELLYLEHHAGVTIVDPVTLDPYEYMVLGVDSYELCATFQLEGSSKWGREYNNSWWHDAGRFCYKLYVPERP